jgi:hypothetical protein
MRETAGVAVVDAIAREAMAMGSPLFAPERKFSAAGIAFDRPDRRFG